MRRLQQTYSAIHPHAIGDAIEVDVLATGGRQDEAQVEGMPENSSPMDSTGPQNLEADPIEAHCLPVVESLQLLAHLSSCYSQ